MGPLLFRKEFHAAIRDGSKRTTIRRWNDARVRPGQLVRIAGAGWLRIESVEVISPRRLTDADARGDGFVDLKTMRESLRRIYPRQSDGRRWYRVRFRWLGDVRPEAI